MKYLPNTEADRVDKQFVWNIYEYLHPMPAKEYYDDALLKGMKAKISKKETIEISDEFLV